LEQFYGRQRKRSRIRISAWSERSECSKRASQSFLPTAQHTAIHNTPDSNGIVATKKIGPLPFHINFGLLQNCWKIFFLAENFHSKMQNLG